MPCQYPVLTVRYLSLISKAQADSISHGARAQAAWRLREVPAKTKEVIQSGVHLTIN